MKRVLKKFMALILAVSMITGLMPGLEIPVKAALEGKLSDTNIAISNNDSGVWKAADSQITGEITGKKTASDGCGNDGKFDYASASTVLTITNNMSAKARLSFDYSTTLNGGTISIVDTDNSKKMTDISGSYYVFLDANESVTVSLTCKEMTKSSTPNTSKIEIKKIELNEVAQVDTIINPNNYKDENKIGEVKVDNSAIENVQTIQKEAETTITLYAEGVNGHKFLGWYDDSEKKYLSYDSEYVYKAEVTKTLKPVFVINGDANFGVNNITFTDLREANTYAESIGGATIVLLKNAQIDYVATISSCNSLVIPYSEANTNVLTTPVEDTAYVKPNAYRTLTMLGKSCLTIEGELCVGGMYMPAQGSKEYGASPSTAYGMINMQSGDSDIIISDGGKAYVWGYIIGAGSVEVQSGAMVYEEMQISDFQGGTITCNFATDIVGVGKNKDKRVFPFTQYYVQNIEVEEIIRSGATEYVFLAMHMSSTTVPTFATFISDQNAMFQMGNNTTITKKYHPETDRLSIDCEGDITLSGIQINVKASIFSATIDSKDFAFPITNNMDVTVDGNAVINQELLILPGATLAISKGSFVTVNENIYVCDSDEWVGKRFVLANNTPGIPVTTDYRPVIYSPTRSNAYLRQASDLVDAQVDINGTVYFYGKRFFTTKGGANVKSSGETGVVVLGENTYVENLKDEFLYRNNGETPVSIPITYAKLVDKEDDGQRQYTDTTDSELGEFFEYNETADKWEKRIVNYNKNADTATGTVSGPILEYDAMSEDGSFAVTIERNAYTNSGYNFIEWNTKADGTGTAYKEGAAINVTKAITLYAQWTPKSITLKFDVKGNGENVVKIEGLYGEKVSGVPSLEEKKGHTASWIDASGKSVAIPATFPADNATYTASWKKNSYAFSFNLAGGTFPSEISIPSSFEYETDISTVLPQVDSDNAPIKEGYTFTGWNPEVPATMPDENVSVTAQWEANEYKISYNTDGGSEVAADAPEFAKTDETVNLPAAPTKVGYTFAGWSLNGTLLDKEAVSFNMPPQNTTLTATWTINEYTITFDTDGGSVVNPITQNYNTEVTAPADPTKTGYTFAGWDVKVPEKMPAGNMTITAQWEANEYDITYDTAGGSKVSEDAPKSAKTDDMVQLPEAPVKAGYTFKAWALNGKALAEDAETFTMPPQNAVLTAVYTADSFDITYDTDGGSEVSDEAPASAKTDDAVQLPAAPEKKGYTFEGWALNGTALARDAETFTMPPQKANLKALWTINSYTVTFDSKGGSSVESVTQEFNTDIAEPTEPTKEGNTFLGWYYDEKYTSKVEFPFALGTKDITVYAKWSVNTYKITIIDGISEEPEVVETLFGDAVNYTLPTVDSDEAPKKEGYTFAGWDGSIPATMPAKNMTINAKWNINSYNVKFVVDGVTVYSKPLEYNTDIQVPEDPSKEGHTFDGWSPEVGKVPAHDVTYTAQWTVHSHKVIFADYNDELIKESTVYYGTQIEKPANPVREGHTFTGWSPEVPATMPDEALTFKATYSVNPYTVTVDLNKGSLAEGDEEYPLNQVLDYGANITLPSDPVRPGYEFTEWTVEGVEELPSTVPSKDIVFIAQWDALPYSITFDLDYEADDDEVAKYEAINADCDADISDKLPANPTREGYTFDGWKAEDNKVYGTSGNPLPATMPVGGMKLTAQWTINQYTISFETTFKDVTVESITRNYGVKVTKPADPVKEGYTFQYWKDSDGNKVTWPVTMPASGVTYTAVWTPNQYIVSFLNGYGGTISSVEMAYNTDITLPENPTRPGYEFVGWIDEEGTLYDEEHKIPETVPAHDVIIKAKWSANTYVITYKLNEGTLDLTNVAKEAKTDETVELPAAPEKTGYTFAGWYLNGTKLDDNATSFTMPSQNAELEAKWTVNQYTITFNTVGGSTIEAITGNYGDVVNVDEIADPIKEGHTFDGWDREIPTMIPADNVTINAKWKVNNYSITFDSDGGSDVGTISANYGASLQGPKDPTRTGYNFQGWYNGDTKVTFPLVMPEGGLNLTAKWTEKTGISIYFVTGYGNNLSLGHIEGTFGQNITDADGKIPEDPTRGGYNFVGWEPKVPETIPAEDMTIQAIWEKGTYEIIFDSNGAGDVESISAKFEESISVNPETPEKEGYTFLGWFDANGVQWGTKDKPFPTKMPANGLSLTAKWQINQYKVTYANTGDTVIAPVTDDFGTEIVKPEDPEKEGYTFVGWVDEDNNLYDDNNKFPASIPAKDIIITATWAVNQYLVTFEDGYSEKPVIYSENQDYGSAITAPADPTRTGYKFAGWTPAVDTIVPASDVTYTATWEVNQYTITIVNGIDDPEVISVNYGDSVDYKLDESLERAGYTFDGWDKQLPEKMPAENVVITALWTANNYTITFANTGDSVIAPITKAFGTGVTAPADPVKEGYSFDGWDTQIPPTMPAGDLVITAKWKINQYTITFDAAGGTEVAEITQNYNTDVAAPVAPTKTGYTFDGWTPSIPEKMPSSDMTITAQWTINQYDVIFKDGYSDTLVHSGKQDYNSKITAPADPEREGYTFTGWEPVVDEKVPANDVVYTAQWQGKPYTITFNSNGGTEVGVIKANCGDNIEKPAAPEKEGYSFVGWAIDDNDEETIPTDVIGDDAFPVTMPVNGRAYEAVWSINTYEVEYFKPGDDGWEAVAYEPTEITYGTTLLDVLPTPVKEGYTFTGWKMDDGGLLGNIFLKDVTEDTKMPAKKVAFYETWTINQYTISFDEDGGTKVDDITMDYNSEVTAPTEPTKTGYTFKGWVPGVPERMPADNITVKAQWSINQYTISFDENGGSKVNDITGDYNTEVTMPAEPTKTGYTFGGWEAEDGTVYGTEEEQTSFPERMPAENVALTAIWNINEYELTFVTNGGNAIDPIKQDYATIVTAPADPEKEGFTFVCWTDKDGNKLEIAKSMPAENVTYYAKWQINQYTISFDENGGTEVADITQNYNSEVTAPTEPVKPGYTFAGWYKGDTKVEFPVNMPVDGLELTAQWTANLYSITFDLNYEVNEEEQINAIHANCDEKINKPADPERKGYTFIGWKDEVNDTIYGVLDDQKAFPERMPAGGLALTAIWQINQYTITFDSNGGSKVAEITKDFGFEVAAPNVFREGYTLSGWYDGDTKVEFPLNMPVDGMNLKAEWQINQYTITFDTDGGNAINPITQNYATDVTAPEAPKKEGHTFAGWDVKIPETMPAGDMTIKALWNVNSYTITFDTLGGNDLEPFTAAYGTVVPVPADPEREGYTFLGWNTKIPGTVPAQNMTITAKWSAIEYTITFDENGGSNVSDIKAPYETNVKEPKAPEKEGHTFLGWAETVDGELVLIEKFPETMPLDGMELTAVWTADEHTITFDTDGGNEIDSIKANYGVEITKPADPVKEGFAFTGWVRVVDGKEVEFKEFPETMPAYDILLKATWDANVYTITFDTDGGNEIASISKPYGSEIAAPEDPVREGYTFEGWDKKVPDTMPLGDMTIKALWTINEYTITFDTDGGNEIAPITADYATAIIAPADPVREGYTFERWNQEIPETMPAGDVTIKAIWKVNQYSITFDSNGGSAVESITEDYGTVLTAPADPERAGYTFAGWVDAVSGNKAELPATMPAVNLGFVAQWTANQYTITFDTDGGSVVETITAFCDEDIKAPEAPEKTGYTFAGWVDAEGNTVEFPATMPAGGLELTADWDANSYRLYIDDGVNEVIDIMVDYGTELDPLVVPDKEGHTFIAWFGARNEYIKALPATMPAKDLTAIAQWEVMRNIVLRFVDEDGTTLLTTRTADFGEAFEPIADPVREGYTFLGWIDAEGNLAEVPVTMPESRMTFIASWEIKTCTVTIDNGTDTPIVITGEYGDEITEVIENPEREGYTFTGWIDAETENTVTIPDTIPGDDMNIKPSWKVNEYTITFMNGTEVVDTITAEFGDTIEAPTVNEKDGFKFVGWDMEVPATMPAEDMVITAVWENIYTGWYEEEAGTTYLVKGEKSYFDEWTSIDGEDYYFNDNSYIVKGLVPIEEETVAIYLFDVESGAFRSDYTGVYGAEGDYYWVEEGKVVLDKGLTRVEDPDVEGGHIYYYFKEDGKAVKSATIWFAESNKDELKGLLPTGEYTFGKDGEIMHIDDTTVNGIVDEDDGKHYYIDGISVHAGLIKSDGHYYYVKTNGQLVISRTYWVTKTNGLLSEGNYQFNDKGQIVFPDETKNGIYEEDGKLYYYENDVRTYKGLFELDGYYYYARTSGQLARSCDYWTTKTNDLLPEKLYTFNDKGQIVFEEEIPEEVKNGIIAENGGLYYYVDGVLTYAGLIKHDGHYYYVRTSGQLVTSCMYWITMNNDLLPQARYTFNDKGQIVFEEDTPEEVKNGIVAENDSLFYYVDGVLTYAGLIEIDGDYYYVRTSGEVVHNRTYWITKTNDLMSQGSYTFDADGKMTN